MALRDVEGAAVALARHYARTATRVFSSLEPEHDLAHLRATLATVAPGAEDSL